MANKKTPTFSIIEYYKDLETLRLEYVKKYYNTNMLNLKERKIYKVFIEYVVDKIYKLQNLLKSKGYNGDFNIDSLLNLGKDKYQMNYDYKKDLENMWDYFIQLPYIKQIKADLIKIILVDTEQFVKRQVAKIYTIIIKVWNDIKVYLDYKLNDKYFTEEINRLKKQ